MKEHLRSRGWNPWVSDIIEGDGVVYFPLYSLSGKIVGVQQYREVGEKKCNDKDTAKYWTHKAPGTVSFFLPRNFYDATLEDTKTVFVQEGIFSCLPIAACGFKTVAILTSNNFEAVRNLRLMGYRVVSLCDGDKAGTLITKHLDDYVNLPDGKDVGDLYLEGGCDMVYQYCKKLLGEK